jgi:hypothetical protein
MRRRLLEFSRRPERAHVHAAMLFTSPHSLRHVATAQAHSITILAHGGAVAYAVLGKAGLRPASLVITALTRLAERHVEIVAFLAAWISWYIAMESPEDAEIIGEYSVCIRGHLMVYNDGIPCAICTGRSKAKVVPRPSLLAARISRPCSSTMRLAMARPSPAPPRVRILSDW